MSDGGAGRELRSCSVLDVDDVDGAMRVVCLEVVLDAGGPAAAVDVPDEGCGMVGGLGSAGTLCRPVAVFEAATRVPSSAAFSLVGLREEPAAAADSNALLRSDIVLETATLVGALRFDSSRFGSSGEEGGVGGLRALDLGERLNDRDDRRLDGVCVACELVGERGGVSASPSSPPRRPSDESERTPIATRSARTSLTGR